MPEVQVNKLLDYLPRAIPHDAEPPADPVSQSDLVLGRGREIEDRRRPEPALDAGDDRFLAVVLLQPVWKQEPSVGVFGQGGSEPIEVARCQQLAELAR